MLNTDRHRRSSLSRSSISFSLWCFGCLHRDRKHFPPHNCALSFFHPCLLWVYQLLFHQLAPLERCIALVLLNLYRPGDTTQHLYPRQDQKPFPSAFHTKVGLALVTIFGHGRPIVYLLPTNSDLSGAINQLFVLIIRKIVFTLMVLFIIRLFVTTI
jgi:hypothetical protein